MKAGISKKLQKLKESIHSRIDKRNFPKTLVPQLGYEPLDFDLSMREKSISFGGIGAIHTMVQKIGLIDAINENVPLLKFPLPYHESDHVLNICYNSLLNGKRLEDIELLRNNEAYLNALGAVRTPSVTTAGDFMRRFSKADVEKLMETINGVRATIWNQRPNLLEVAFIDVDGSIVETTGETKEGMDISYKGIWGFHPLLISLANTNEVLYTVNRSGNQTSNQGCIPWLDKAIDLVKPHSNQIILRGDTDFTCCTKLDDWSEKSVDFVLGFGINSALTKHTQKLPDSAWKPLKRKEKEPLKTEPRGRFENIREKRVIEREYINIKLNHEDVAEFEYSPTNCKKNYRIVVVRKNLTKLEGKVELLDYHKYFYYITSLCNPQEEIVMMANGRCNQENLVEQMKNGVNAFKSPLREFNANWAYMVIASLAWNLKAWFGILMSKSDIGAMVMKMEARTFYNSFMAIPAQIIRSGRKTIYRFQGWGKHLEHLLEAWHELRKLKIASLS